MARLRMVPIPKEVIELTFQVLDQKDIDEILLVVRSLDLITFETLAEIARKAGKTVPVEN